MPNLRWTDGVPLRRRVVEGARLWASRASERLGRDQSWGPPLVFQVELTNFCNLRCPMCPRTEHMKRAVGYMDLALFRSIVDQVAPYQSRLGVTHFGESLFHPDLGPALAYAKSRGLATSMPANAAYLPEEIAGVLIEAGLAQFVVSFDGMSAASYEKYRRNAKFETTVANVESVIRLRNERGSRTPRLVVKMNLLPDNAHEVDAFRSFWKERADEVWVWPSHSWTVPELLDVVQIRSHPQAHATSRICRDPWESLCVLWDGRVVPCCFDHDGAYVLGDASRESLISIWRNEAFQRLRRAMTDGRTREVALCRHCPRAGP